MGCLCSKPISSNLLTPLKSGSVLWTAQRMTRVGDHQINETIDRRIRTEADMKRLLETPNLNEDFLAVLSPPLSDFNELKHYLFLTSIGGLTRENLTNNGIIMIINATYEWPLIQTDAIVSYRVPVDDGETDDISKYFEEVSDKINECKTIGGKCVVHCMAGASRSTTLVLAYLIKYERMPLKYAYRSVRKRRDCARPNLNFWEQLIRYEIKTRGKRSVNIVSDISEGFVVRYPDLYMESENQDYLKIVIQKQISIQKAKQIDPNFKTRSEKQFNETSLTYE